MAYKYIKAKWIATNAGGGNSIVGFKEIEEEFIERPDGGTEYVTSDKPKVVTIMPARSNPADGAKPIIKGDQSFIINKGEFIVQDIPDNRKTLKMMVMKNWIRLADWELHQEMSEIDLNPQVIEKVVKDDSKRIDITPEGSKAAREKKKKEKAAILAERIKGNAAKES